MALPALMSALNPARVLHVACCPLAACVAHSCIARYVLSLHPPAPLAGGFDLSNPTRLRNAHMGPILTLALTDT